MRLDGSLHRRLVAALSILGVLALAEAPACSDCGRSATCWISNCPSTLVTRGSRFRLQADCSPCDRLGFQWTTRGAAGLVDPLAAPGAELVDILVTDDGRVELVVTGEGAAYGMVTLRGVDGLDRTENYTCAFEIAE